MTATDGKARKNLFAKNAAYGFYRNFGKGEWKMKAKLKKWLRATGVDQLLLGLIEKLALGLIKKLTALKDGVRAILDRATQLRNGDGE